MKNDVTDNTDETLFRAVHGSYELLTLRDAQLVKKYVTFYYFVHKSPPLDTYSDPYLHLRLDLPRDIFPSCFLTIIIRALLIYLCMLYVQPISFGKEYRLRSSSLRHVLQPVVTAPHLSPSILLSTYW
jgi:hypothetical protein